MNRFSPLLKRLSRLEPMPEPWPPDVEGSLFKFVNDQLKEEGVDLPTEMPDKPFMFLLMKSAEVSWLREAVDGAA